MMSYTDFFVTPSLALKLNQQFSENKQTLLATVATFVHNHHQKIFTQYESNVNVFSFCILK